MLTLAATCKYVCMYVCMHVSMYVRMYVYMYLKHAVTKLKSQKETKKIYDLLQLQR